MKRAATIACLLVIAATYGVASAKGPRVFRKALDGYDAVPSVSTIGNGQFEAEISKDESQIAWELTYSDLEGAVQQAHIHLGNRGVTGAITVFLCTNLGNGPVGTPPCPAPPITLSGTIAAVDVTNLANVQGLSAGEIDELVRAMRAGVTYVDVHSTLWPGGEIRAQLGRRK
jgi:hypothetical protein